MPEHPPDAPPRGVGAPPDVAGLGPRRPGRALDVAAAKPPLGRAPIRAVLTFFIPMGLYGPVPLADRGAEEGPGGRVTEGWAWGALAGLGAFHGVNPAMGWLFAVALGLQRRSRAAVLWSLLPIALGHALSIGVIVAALAALRGLVDRRPLQLTSAVVLLAFGLYRLVARHRARGGMQVGAGDLVLWSFLMATGHGAGLMLLPVLLELPIGPEHGAHAHAAAATLGRSPITALAAVAVHTAAMLAVASVIAVAVYDWIGLAFLRRGWINVDLLWAVALIAAGAVLVVAAIL